MIPGYDHHCSWLNTAIGKRNYVNFITMAFSAWFQCILHLVVLLLSLTSWLDKEGVQSVEDTFKHIALFKFLVSLLVIIYLFFGLGLSTLCLFHMYLVFFLHKSTYDFLVMRREGRSVSTTYQPKEQSEEEKEELEKKKEGERQAWLKEREDLARKHLKAKGLELGKKGGFINEGDVEMANSNPSEKSNFDELTPPSQNSLQEEEEEISKENEENHAIVLSKSSENHINGGTNQEESL